MNVGQQYTRLVTHLEGKRFDPTGEYVKRWIPELRDVPVRFIHKPWKMDEQMQEKYNCQLGLDYPHPIRDPTVGELKRKKRYLQRRGVDWSEEGTVVPHATALKRQKDPAENVINRNVSPRDDDWYSDMNLVEKEGETKSTKWNVTLDDAIDEEWSSHSSTTKDSV